MNLLNLEINESLDTYMTGIYSILDYFWRSLNIGHIVSKLLTY